MSGDLLPLEVDEFITCHAFFELLCKVLHTRSHWQITLSREVNEEFVTLEPIFEPLYPQSNEIFMAFVEPTTYAVHVKLSSTDAFDCFDEANPVRYERYIFFIVEYDGESNNYKSEAIYTVPFHPDTTSALHFPFFLESDDIPVENVGRFHDEYIIAIPRDMTPFHTVQELMDHSSLGEGLSDRTKQRLCSLFIDEIRYYIQRQVEMDPLPEDELEEPTQQAVDDDHWL